MTFDMHQIIPGGNALQILPSVQAMGWSRKFLNDPH